MTAGYAVRRARLDEITFLWEMLYEAAYWRPGAPHPPIEEMQADDHNARYLESWGRHGDVATVAEVDGELLGAAWFRLFSEDRHGYGFIDAATPELAIGVQGDRRGRGIGTALLRALFDEAVIEGFGALSLSVEFENPALRLYERLGFTRVERVGGAWTMRRAL